jgi:glycine dehydrogenase
VSDPDLGARDQPGVGGDGGLQVVPVACDDHGNVDLGDLAAKASLHADRLAALMITYPSTHGVFEASIREICETVHGTAGRCTWTAPT